MVFGFQDVVINRKPSLTLATNSRISSGGGAVLVEGVGGGAGNSNSNHGVAVFEGGTISSAGTNAMVIVKGFGGNFAGTGDNNLGVIVGNSGSQITSSGGDIEVIGREGGGSSSFGIVLTWNGRILGTSGNLTVTLTADSMDLVSSTAVDAGGNRIVLMPRTAGTLIDLGGDDVFGGSQFVLGLTDAELDRIKVATLTIGNAGSGTITLTEPITRPVSTNLSLISGGAIVFDPGSLDTAGGTLLLAPGNAGVQPLTVGTDVTASGVSFSDGAELAIQIDGTTVDTEYSQLNVAGKVDLTGAALLVSGSYTPAVGDTFTVVNNSGSQPVIGTFTGLPEGAVIPDFLGSGLPATITYGGGDGNDVVIKQTGGTRTDMTIVAEPSAVGDGGEVASLPGSVDWVHEWQMFWVEIWVGAPDMPTLAVAGATVDLRYNTDYLTALEIVHGPAFTIDETGTIDDAVGRVGRIGGSTGSTGAAGDGYLLLARVRFASTGDDQVPVDEVGRNIGPYDMQMALGGGEVVLVGAGAVVPELGGAPGTELWAVMYDIEENNRIDFGDLSYFAPAFGLDVGPPESQPPYVWWADFDKSGRVDYGDLSFFTPNFAKRRDLVQSGAQTLVFPPNFPAAWRAVPNAPGGEGDAMGGDAVFEPSSVEDRVLAGADSLPRGSHQPDAGLRCPRQLSTRMAGLTVGTRWRKYWRC